MPATLNQLEKDYLKLHKQVQEYISVLKVQSTSVYDGDMEIKPKKERSALGQKIGGKIKNIGDAIKKKKKDL